MDIRPKEQRRFPRIKFQNPLHCQVRGSPDSSSTISDNISLNGIGFINDRYLPALTSIMLEINLLTRVLHPIGRVVWSAPFPHSDRFKAGVEFFEFDQQEKQFLSDFITMKLHQL
jgi:hypothetical protein